MRGVSHALTSASAVVVWVGWAHPDPMLALGVTAVAAATAGGPLSPDCDILLPGWRAADDVLPDEALGHGGPMQHRGITHWWGLPVLLFAAGWWLGWGLEWLWTGVALGWLTHDLGDMVFGRRHGRRGPGVPLLGWWGHVGVGLKSGGWTEGVLMALWPVVVAWQVASLTLGAPAPWTLVLERI